MRRRQALSQAEATIEFVPASLTRSLDFRELFVRAGPVEIDLGCGDGAFVTALAAAHPERNFLGVECLQGRVNTFCRRATRLGLLNARVLRMDASYALTWLVLPATATAVHLLFPDPWPKRRHHRRRTVTENFVAAVYRALVPDGLFHIATDHPEYFQTIRRLISPRFQQAPIDLSFPQSTFEQRFAAVPIYRLMLRKVSPVK